MSERLRVAIVGGGFGVYHINAFKNLPERYDIVALCDINRDKAERIASEHAIPSVTADITDLCGRDDLDIIDICTPPSLHFTHIQQVLASGKHVICEKPLVSSLKEVDDLMVAEAQAGQRVMPIFQYRFGH